MGQYFRDYYNFNVDSVSLNHDTFDLKQYFEKHHGIELNSNNNNQSENIQLMPTLYFNGFGFFENPQAEDLNQNFTSNNQNKSSNLN